MATIHALERRIGLFAERTLHVERTETRASAVNDGPLPGREAPQRRV
jgi:hypothetical protein